MPSMSRTALIACVVETILLSRFLRRGYLGTFGLLLPIHLLLLALWKIVLWPLVFSPLRHLPEPQVDTQNP